MKNSNNIIPLISFPRSGNTWLRFIFANLLKADHIDNVDYSNLNSIMPTERKQIANFDYSLLTNNAPIMLKEHYNYYNLNLSFNKSIYLKRNFLDTMESYWYFLKNKEPLLFDNFDEFIRTYWRYCGTHTNHIQSMKKIKNSKNIHIINFEDLHSDTFSTVSNCLKFLELDFSDKRINQAIEASNYNRLKKFKQNIFTNKKDIKSLKQMISNHDDMFTDKNIYNRLLNYYIGLRFKLRKLKSR